MPIAARDRMPLAWAPDRIVGWLEARQGWTARPTRRRASSVQAGASSSPGWSRSRWWSASGWLRSTSTSARSPTRSRNSGRRPRTTSRPAGAGRAVGTGRTVGAGRAVVTRRGSGEPPPPLSTGGLAHALDALREEVGLESRPAPRAGGAGRDRARRAEWQRAGRLPVDRRRASRSCSSWSWSAPRTASSRPPRSTRLAGSPAGGCEAPRPRTRSRGRQRDPRAGPDRVEAPVGAQRGGAERRESDLQGAPVRPRDPADRRHGRARHGAPAPDAARTTRRTAPQRVHRECERRVQRNHSMHGAVPAVASARGRVSPQPGRSSGRFSANLPSRIPGRLTTSIR